MPAHNAPAPAYKYSNSRGTLRQTVSIYQCFQPNMYWACAETVISEFPVKVLTPPLHSVPIDSHWENLPCDLGR